MKNLNRLSLVLLVSTLASFVAAADSSVENLPGFVDFSELRAMANVEPIVEISLKAPLLNMMTNLVRNEDAEAAEFMSKLFRVTVNVFESDAIDVSAVADSMNSISQDLDSKGWDRVVRVRDQEEHVDIYFRFSDDADRIQGIAIMVAEPRGDTVLVNIVGDISVDDISALGERFDIDELANIDID
ncbi:MAG: hypothetical protein ACI95C_001708 [Pseudohongiellaceae bacterium]|jgi:hypothetical protein